MDPSGEIESAAETPTVGPSEQQISLEIAAHQFRQGPLPPPADLSAYGEVDPSFPERIMRMAEQGVENLCRYNDRMGGSVLVAAWLPGGVPALLVAVAVSALAVVLVVIGEPIPGAMLGAAEVVLLLIWLLRQRRSSVGVQLEAPPSDPPLDQ